MMKHSMSGISDQQVRMIGVNGEVRSVSLSERLSKRVSVREDQC